MAAAAAIAIPRRRQPGMAVSARATARDEKPDHATHACADEASSKKPQGGLGE